MIKKQYSFLILSLVFLFSVNNYGQTSKLLIEVQNSFKKLDSFSSDFVQYSNGKVNLYGKLFFKKPNKMKLDLKNIQITSDGKTVWNYMKKQNKVMINNYDESDPSLFTIDKFLFDYPSKCVSADQSENGKSFILLTPKEDFESFKKAKLYINDKNELKRISITDINNNLIEFELKNLKYNLSLVDSDFIFTPPNNSKIIDLR